MELDQIKKLRHWLVSQPEFKLLLEIAQELKTEVFLVGGLVRDCFLSRETQDVDLALSREALKAARHFARKTGGTFVLLRREGEMARVVFQGRTFDFANYRGPDLETDLRSRDFTVNAIALSLAKAFSGGEWMPYDPLNGIGDINKRVLKTTGGSSFKEDPLRMLRAYRLSAQLDMSIDPETSKAIEKNPSRLTQCAPERLHYEWLMLLSQPASFIAIQAMDRTGLLETLFPELKKIKGVAQDRYHHLDVFQHCLLTLQSLEEVIQKKILLPKDIEEDLNQYLKRDQKGAWLKWAALLHDLGKAVTGREKNGHKTFYGHAEVSLNWFDSIAQRFRLSHREKDFIFRMIGWHMRPFYLIQEQRQKILSRRAIIRMVRDTGEEIDGLFLLALADSLAAKGKEKPQEWEDQLINLWQESLSAREALFCPQGKTASLVNGTDLIQMGLKPGPEFKTILAEIQEEQILGRLGSRKEALEWIRYKLNLV